MHPSVAVIVPFFQRREGLLARCLRSIETQSVRAAIYVVDDGSPIAARDEIKGLSPELQTAITLIEQPNGGAAAARNRALNETDKGTEFVAFLDSDDAWRNHHLSDALRAMRDDVDFYFCDRWITDAGKSGAEAGAGRPGSEAYREAPPDFSRGPRAVNVSGSPLKLVMSGIIPTSGVVYRFSKNPTIRFTDRLSTWEDYLFFLTLFHNSRAVIFDAAPGYDVGRGVSISSVEWGDRASVRHGQNLVQMLRIAMAELPLSPEDTTRAVVCLREAQKDVARAVLYFLRRRKLADAFAPIAADIRLLPVVAGMALALIGQRDMGTPTLSKSRQ